MNNIADPSSIKYQVKAKINADGIVDKPDVVGAIFGQTEGLLGDNLDLRDLQKSGRIGRVEVEIVSKGGKSDGIIYMSSTLDQVETAIIAATLETIDRVGPCRANIKVIDIIDIRTTKREQIAERAKELLGVLMEQAKGSGSNITQNIRESLQVEEITTYGKERCPAGPSVKSSEAIIVVEGRSDVLNLLRAGIKNAVAVEGTNIPKSVQELSKERVTTAFVDGDRGGELILRELFQTSEIDYVARAPRSQEVEELSAKQLVKCLRNKVPGDQYMEMNRLSFEEKELGEDDRKENDRGYGRDRHVRRNAEEFAEERGVKSQNDENEEVPSFRVRRANEDDEEDTRFATRNGRERRRNSDDDSGEGKYGRNRRERHVRRNSDDDDEMPPRGRFDRKKREFQRRDVPEDFGESVTEEIRPWKRRDSEEEDTVRIRKRRVSFEETEVPETESVITETEDGNIVVEEVEIKEPVAEETAAEEQVTAAPAEETPVTEVPGEPVAEEPVTETLAPAEEEEKPRKTIRSPRSRKAKTDKILTEEQENYRNILGDITGTKNAVLLNAEGGEIDKVEVKNLANYLKENDASDINSIVFDGVIGQNIVGIASEKGIRTLVGKTRGKIAKLPAELIVWTRTDLF